MEKIKIGISSCLLGNKVRYDGQHKWDRFITDTLGRWCEFVPVCPEVECGLPIPRESMRLEGDPENPRLVTGRSRIDLTEKMMTYTAARLEQLAREDLVGFIFKTKSPSSGLRGVKIYGPKGSPISYSGQGLFARAFVNRFPRIPVEDEGRLQDPGIRENFIETIFVLQRWREMEAARKPGGLVDFHSRHKYTLMAHSPEKLKALGKLTGRAGKLTEETRDEYFQTLLDLLALKKTPKKNYNVILHIAGYFKGVLTSGEKEELLETAEQYHQGLVPLIVPLTLLRHYTRKYEEPYLSQQYYLNPHPVEMGLLNHV